MKNYIEYKKLLIKEVEEFKSQITPSLNNSPKKGSERITQFFEILTKVEKHMDEYCSNYFKGQSFNPEELAELKAINTKVYQDFIDYCKIPGISKIDWVIGYPPFTPNS